MKWGILVELPVVVLFSVSTLSNILSGEYSNPQMFLPGDSTFYHYYYGESGKLIKKLRSTELKYFVIRTMQTSGDIYAEVSKSDTTKRDKGDIIFRPADVISISRKTARQVRNLIAHNIINDTVRKYVFPVADKNTLGKMISEIKDDGKGDTNSVNNKEYGGLLKDSIIIEVVLGEKENPCMSQRIVLLIRGTGDIEFHSHPSGHRKNEEDTSSSEYIQRKVTATGSLYFSREVSKCYFIQGVSKDDQEAVGDRIGYVFGMRNRCIYIYDQEGIKATLPFSFFEKRNK